MADINGDGGRGLVFVILAIYFLPGFVALMRQHHDRAAIFLLNLLAGWSVLGWVWALVWSATAVRTVAPIKQPVPPEGVIEE